MLALIKPRDFMLGLNPDTDDSLHYHKNYKGHNPTIQQSNHNSYELGYQLAEVTVQEALPCLIDRGIGKYTREDGS
jgi:hypothetical protein